MSGVCIPRRTLERMVRREYRYADGDPMFYWREVRSFTNGQLRALITGQWFPHQSFFDRSRGGR
jgi:hypothetical protein